MELENELFRTILSTRDMCGNEREAAKQVFADHGMTFDDEMFRKAKYVANSQWNTDQRAAGIPEKYLW